MKNIQTVKRNTHLVSLTCATTFLGAFPAFKATGAPQKATPAPSTAPAPPVEAAPPKAIPVLPTAPTKSAPTRTVPLPKKRIDVQYSFDKNGIKSGGNLKSLIGKVMVPSMEHTKLIYEINATQLHVTFRDLRDGDDGVKFSSHSQMEPNGSVLKETQNSGGETEVMEATVESVPFLGKCKAVRWFDEDDMERRGKPKNPNNPGQNGDRTDASRESLIDPNEIITTLLQIPVWASTIRGDLSQQPLPFRMCVKGEPIQMRLTEGRAASKDEVVYRCERVGGKGGDTEALFTLTYERQEMMKGFALPIKMQIHVGTMEMNVRRDGLENKK